MQLTQRRIPLTGAYNVRDAGGYETQDGRFIKPRTLFRADSLHALTPDDQNAVAALGLRTMIDLRREEERAADPNPFAETPTVAYQHLPLHPGWSTILEHGKPNDLAHLYQAIIDNAQAGIFRVMSTVANQDAFPLLVHCQIGKDRTGIITALLLSVAKVPYETIIADYALSHHYLQPIFEKYRQNSQQNGFDMVLFEKLVQSPPQVMAATLAHLDDCYGGPWAYLRQIGMSEAQLRHIQTALWD